jgi:hypothetical protein
VADLPGTRFSLDSRLAPLSLLHPRVFDFGTPNMFITLWFGFDYGTNPPLGTLII